jgi:DNA polymerase elongation subunit (family B)
MKVMKSPHQIEHKYIGSVLIYDLETDSLNTSSARIKFFGAYSYLHHKYYIGTEKDRERIQELISEHKVLCGYNNKDFDNPIMKANGYDIDYKICLDLFRVLYNPEKRKDNRKLIIECENGERLSAMCKNNKLRDIAATLNLSSAKGDIDYKIFQKDSWTEEEIKEIEHYLFLDLQTTRELFEFMLNYFKGFMEMVGDEDIKNFNYIRSSTGSFAYSAISHAIGKKAVYPDGERPKMPKYDGGFVLQPWMEMCEDVMYFDFTSLYPHIEIMCNLFSPKIGGWKGGTLFKTHGEYDDTKMGIIEEKLYEFFKTRNELKKKKDPRQLGYKIVINSIYGISSVPVFINVYNPTVAMDTCYLGQQFIELAIKMFRDNGFQVLAADTDSCFVRLGDKSAEECLEVSKKITQTILDNVPFPVPTFSFKLEHHLQKIWFPGLKKKHYAYIDENNKFHIVGLEVIKGDASILSKEILKDLIPAIQQRKDMRFDKKFISDIAMKHIKQDISIIGRNYRVRAESSYDTDASIHAQIAKVLGEGEHILIPNKRLGDIGKKLKYCTVEQSKELSIDDLDLDKFWNEMDAFLVKE